VPVSGGHVGFGLDGSTLWLFLGGGGLMSIALSPPVRNRTALAAAYATAAMLLVGYIDNYVRVIAAEAGLWQFHLTRAAMALPMLVVLSRVLGLPLWPKNWRVVALRSLFGSTSMLVYFGCLALLPIGQVLAGLFTAPIFVALISASAFGARIGALQWLAILLGFGGTGLVLGLDPATLGLLSLMPVLSGLIYAMSGVVTREYCGDENPLTLLAGFFGMMAFWGCLGLLVLALMPQPVEEGAAGFVMRGWVAPTGLFLFWTLAQAMGSIFGVGLIIMAYQIAEAPRVAVFENTLLVFAAIWAWILWGEGVGIVALFGMGAIVLSGILIATAPAGRK
jgi:drug/metabolite transporter (DMT)-like permease